ncbi:predicted protein [Chaetomium globosum CBS 148.51]|uniref:Uncharacterized protein n=1 Tax=Chaetomium globosum (strain ATCC 6205 / CBS 148.51 / DSM 1962 / NBRC 6347 / NRRL 1970) TaxID=306901 RepID=Q2GQT1_CHAGB|nr:uncharacterized protein CHGG_09673 [Chaetomium globosum CBS 148.51]EAQ83269.1 predicted protein [Chaetomium globosum CBS 148.51]
MAGPRAPIGTLSQHAATAAGLVRGMVPKMFTRTDPKRTRNADKPVESESESDSDSDSDSSSGSDTETKRDTKSWGETMKAKKNVQDSESSASESSSEDDEDDKMAVDSEPDSKSEKKTIKSKSAQVKLKAEDTSSDAESASSDEESDGDSAPAVKPDRKADSAPVKTSSSDEESASESEAESESEDESQDDSEDEPEPAQRSKSKSAPGPKSSTTVNGNTKGKEVASRSENTSDAESADTEQSASDSEDEDMTESTAVEKLSGKTTVPPPREIVTQGFHLRKAKENVDAAAVARAFKKAKAERQTDLVLHDSKVCAYRSYPETRYSPGQGSMLERAIFAHEGSEYTGQFEEPVNHAIKVLIPGKTGTSYEAHSQSVDRVLHITRDIASTPVKKSKKVRVESASIEQVDPSPAESEPSPVKKSKGKEKSKKNASSSAEESSEAGSSSQDTTQRNIRAASVPPGYQSMSEMRKATEAAQAMPPNTPTKTRIASLTPVPIPGVYTPRKVIPSQPWTAKGPSSNLAPPNGTPNGTRYGTPSASSQPPKGILKTPDREQSSGGKDTHSGSQGKSKKKIAKKNRMPRISWQGGTKCGHGSY